jgi:nitronate monooxygenase
MPSLNARTPEKLREDLEWIRARTDKPFGINLTIGLTAPQRRQQDLELCLEYEVPVLITSYGNPTEYAKVAHDRGMIVFHDVINLRHALKAQSAGVDAIIGVAAGAGGHAGTTSPYALYPYLREQLEIPVIAAGCISTGEQVAASFSLGAELCYMGTRFITSTECGAQPEYKQMVLDAVPEDIVYTDKVTGTNASFLRQSFPPEDGQRDGSEAKRWRDIWSAGQGSALIHKVQPVQQIVDEVVREYHDTLARLPRANTEGTD